MTTVGEVSFGELLQVSVVAIIGYAALFLLIGAPAILLARRRSEEAPTVRRFIRAAVGAGLFFGIMAAGSRRLVAQCLDNGNPNCHDYGATGLVAVVIAGFVITSGFTTWRLITD